MKTSGRRASALAHEDRNPSVIETDRRKEQELRANRPLSATPRPFLRWAGSKQRLLRQLLPLVPATFERYYEPFLGSAALFFLLLPPDAVLSDTCEELIATYEAVRGNPNVVLRHLAGMNPKDRDYFYAVREKRSRGPYKRGAEFIFLNRAGWNGLYRVNSLGQYNVPYGAPKTSGLVDPKHLRECSKALQRPTIRIRAADFESAVTNARRGDFVYFDPPYVTGHNNNGFIDYNQNLFSWNDQIRLAKLVNNLSERGVKVLLTNADHRQVREMYSGFKMIKIHRASTIAGDLSARTSVTEIAVRNYDPSE
jgi:DNA adenine methylase